MDILKDFNTGFVSALTDLAKEHDFVIFEDRFAFWLITLTISFSLWRL